MRQALHDRRRHTWRLLVVEGVSRSEAIQRLADTYDVSEETIAQDIDNMDDWLAELDVPGRGSEASRLHESRENRQRLHEMAREAQQVGDLELELQIRREIRQALSVEQTLRTAGDEEDEDLNAAEAWSKYVEAADSGAFENEDYRVVPEKDDR